MAESLDFRFHGNDGQKTKASVKDQRPIVRFYITFVVTNQSPGWRSGSTILSAAASPVLTQSEMPTPW